MKTNFLRTKTIFRLCLLLTLSVIAIMVFASCNSNATVVEKEFQNVPSTLYVEDFDPEMNGLREAIDACNITVYLKYSDDTSETFQLKFDMLDDEIKDRLNKPGNHHISYYYKGEVIQGQIKIERLPTYTVRFYDVNGNLISEQLVKKLDSAVEPTEAERDVPGYEFVKWDKSFNKVTRDLDIYGVYEAKIYTVRFFDSNKNLINEQLVKHGETAVAPSDDEMAVEGLNFLGWDKTFDNVTSDLDVYSMYDYVFYTVRFFDNNNNLINEQLVKHGETAVEPSEEERCVVGYEFVEWNCNFNNIKSDLDVYGIYEKLLVVKFYNGKNILIDTQYVRFGEDAKSPSEEALYIPGYVLLRWDTELTNIQQDTEIHGIYINDDTTDTDGDGIIDYIEIEILHLDYTKADTDGDGITDDKEDTDNDGLSNLTEINAGLRPENPDTDSDGLIDGDEIDIYWTLPADPDSDGDGAYDGWEINNGFDPLEYNNSFEVKEKVEMPSNTEITIEIPELSGEYVNTTIIEASTDESIQDVHGSLGEAIQYNVSASATITIASEELQTAEDPVLMYFNNETKQVEPIPVSVSGNEATASITQYGSYVLVDRKVFEEKGQWRDVYTSGSYSSVEIVLLIDDSGSLGGDYGYNSSTGTFTGGKDPNHLRLEVARNFVDNANISAKISIVKFDGVVDNMTNGFIVCDESGKSTLKSKLQFTYSNSGEYNKHNIFDSRGTTYMYTGINEALTQFSSSSPDTLKIIVVFTDGDAHDTQYHSSVINSANAKGVKIYTVGLGTSSYYFDNYLKPLASQTGGEFHNANDAGQLSDIFKTIGERIDMQTDSDSDGLADFFESGVDANGNPTLPTINGVSFVGLDKNNPDTDNDGYLDGKEIEIYQYYSDKNPNQVMIWGIVNSDPTDPESIPAA